MTRRDKIRNEHIRGTPKVVQASTKITDFVAESTLVKKSLIDTAVPLACSDGHKSHHQQLRPGSSVQSRETTEDAGCLRLFQRHDKQDENILVMSEVDFHFNMEAVVELAEGMTIGGVAQTELAFLSYASSL